MYSILLRIYLGMHSYTWNILWSVLEVDLKSILMTTVYTDNQFVSHTFYICYFTPNILKVYKTVCNQKSKLTTSQAYFILFKYIYIKKNKYRWNIHFSSQVYFCVISILWVDWIILSWKVVYTNTFLHNCNLFMAEMFVVFCSIPIFLFMNWICLFS